MGEEGFAPLIHAAIVGADGDTTISALIAIGNILNVCKEEKKYVNEICGVIEKDNLFEHMVEAAHQDGPLQELIGNLLEIIASIDVLVECLREQQKSVAALRKLTHTDCAAIKRAVSEILH